MRLRSEVGEHEGAAAQYLERVTGGKQQDEQNTNWWRRETREQMDKACMENRDANQYPQKASSFAAENDYVSTILVARVTASSVLLCYGGRRQAWDISKLTLRGCVMRVLWRCQGWISGKDKWQHCRQKQPRQ